MTLIFLLAGRNCLESEEVCSPHCSLATEAHLLAGMGLERRDSQDGDPHVVSPGSGYVLRNHAGADDAHEIDLMPLYESWCLNSVMKALILKQYMYLSLFRSVAVTTVPKTFTEHHAESGINERSQRLSSDRWCVHFVVCLTWETSTLSTSNWTSWCFKKLVFVSKCVGESFLAATFSVHEHPLNARIWKLLVLNYIFNGLGVVCDVGGWPPSLASRWRWCAMLGSKFEVKLASRVSLCCLGLSTRQAFSRPRAEVRIVGLLVFIFDLPIQLFR